LDSINLSSYIDEWENLKMDWLFRITRTDENGGTIESIVEKEGIGRYVKCIKYKIKYNDQGEGSLTFTIQPKQSLVIDPEINIVRKNGLTMRSQEVKDLLLKSPVFEEVYDTIPDDFVVHLSRHIIDNNKLDEPYETFQLAYLIDENTRQPPLKLMTTNIS